MEPLITVKEIAAILGVSKAQIYKLINRGKIPHYEIGGKHMFDREKVLKVLEKPMEKGV